MDPFPTLVLERTDGGKFCTAIKVQPSDAADVVTKRPFITIYHFPISLPKVENFSNHLHSSSNRVIGAEKGELRCNDISLISKGSCGGPYVDNLFGVAIGLHIAGTNNVPVGLQFETASTLVLALRTLKILH